MLKYWHLMLILVTSTISLAAAEARIVVYGQDFDEAAFANAQAHDRIILVESYAFWCLACRIQAPLIADIQNSDELGNFVIFRIGEKTPNDVWKHFRLKYYGALIVYRGELEKGRLTGAKTSNEIKELLRTANR
ncbi:MAG: hypothetical protein COZ43_09090 [Sphingomonadales bacterium CG_4_10_14_3_um_filter_58_15]|nr:MAG: hypothetical protein COZ43_09090 [Sphingomonadales bacterium CG_4_10_14_3_um_filter_58_15]